jgi:DNA-binding FrmR family transcriptional regulator
MDKEYGKACAEILNRIVRGEVDAATSVLVAVELANALRKYGLNNEEKEVIDGLSSLLEFQFMKSIRWTLGVLLTFLISLE